jgi:hypothetical protein
MRSLRVLLLGAAVVGAGAAAGCRDFLTADNPGALDAGRLADSTLINLAVNGVIGEFQPIYSSTAYYSAVFTDELRNHHVFTEEIEFDQRKVGSANGTYNLFVYAGLQRARWLADSVGGRLKAFEGDSAQKDVRLARVLAYQGYALITLAEVECEAPAGTGGVLYTRPYKSDELFTQAIAKFNEAIQVAVAARAGNAAAAVQTNGTRANVAAADSIRLLSYVGAARAALGKNDKPGAATFARQVTAFPGGTDFEFRIYFNDNIALTRLNNPFKDRMSGGGGLTTGSITGTPFENIDDARVPYPLDAAGNPRPEAVQGTGSYLVPNSPPSFSTWDKTKPGADFVNGGWMRLASLTEAQYIIAEAEGPTAANIIFVDGRRTAYPSTTAATPTTAVNYDANLRDQRRREFFIDGHRLGDLRRYERYYGVNLWPALPPYMTAAQYGTQKCFPLTTAEITNNPLVIKPYTPPTTVP